MQKESGPKGSLLCLMSNKRLLSWSLCRSLFNSLCRSFLCCLCLNRSLFSNYLNSSSLSLLTAFFLAALVAAAHCSKCNSYDKKHFFHNIITFLSLKNPLCLRLFAKNAAKIQTFLHISKKNCNFAQ